VETSLVVEILKGTTQTTKAGEETKEGSKVGLKVHQQGLARGKLRRGKMMFTGFRCPNSGPNNFFLVVLSWRDRGRERKAGNGAGPVQTGNMAGR